MKLIKEYLAYAEDGLRQLFFVCDDRPARFWWAVSGWFWALFIWLSPVHVPAFKLMFQAAPRTVWAGLFFVHSLFVMWGVVSRQRSSVIHFIGEAVLGVMLWSGLAILYMLAQDGLPSPAQVGMFISLWVMVRYPFAWGKKDD